MKIIHTINDLRLSLKRQRTDGKSISFISTMGALHSGHISLVEYGKNISDITVAGIFLNPSHFAEGEDYDCYPRTLESDCAKLEAAGCDILFAPSVSEIYPLGLDSQAKVSVPFLSDRFCGASRPHLFSAIATIVAKLLNIVQPDFTLLGEKDYQQLAVCRRLVDTLNISTQVIGVPTVRDDNGLALSSRNSYLSDAKREQASYIYQILIDAKRKLLHGSESYLTIEYEATQALERLGFVPDYFNFADGYTLEPISNSTTHVVILCAAYLDSVRLIDNIAFPIEGTRTSVPLIFKQ